MPEIADLLPKREGARPFSLGERVAREGPEEGLRPRYTSNRTPCASGSLAE
jgi:hypothetical protein